MCVFLPRFQCELNPIERCWCHAKKYTRAHTSGSIIRLRKITPEGLQSVSKELINRFFLTCKDFEKAYADSNTCMYHSRQKCEGIQIPPYGVCGC